jgi:hypothetical protein
MATRRMYSQVRGGVLRLQDASHHRRETARKTGMHGEACGAYAAREDVASRRRGGERAHEGGRVELPAGETLARVIVAHRDRERCMGVWRRVPGGVRRLPSPIHVLPRAIAARGQVGDDVHASARGV